MTDDELPDFTPTAGVEEWADLGGYLALLFMDDGRVLFRHRCDRGDRGVIVCAPQLQTDTGGHLVHRRVPPTVTPSILCADCGTHGFVTEGRWAPA